MGYMLTKQNVSQKRRSKHKYGPNINMSQYDNILIYL